MYTFSWCLCFVLLSSVLPVLCGRRHPNHHHHHKHAKQEERPNLYLNEFAIKIDGDDVDAQAIASKYGLINLGKVGELDGWYTFVDRRIRRRSLEFVDRTKRKMQLLKRDVAFVERLKVLSRPKRNPVVNYLPVNDPSWDAMWYMHCGGVNNSDCPCSMRISDAWRAGYHGDGVVVTILDDGIEFSHPDLSSNYDPNASRDINDNDAEPMPRYEPSNENKHGTRCAGVVAAALNNHICGVGVAYGASIGGVRMLDGEVSDKVEATSLNFALNHIDIYSASWGPDDDGLTVEGPGPMAKNAFEVGATRGRQGKGSIFIWASGNGGHNRDSCSCDGYINSIYTVGVSSVSQFGSRPWYLESCASTLASTYSSGEGHEGKVITTDLHRSCSHSHTGTSASAPMAAGVVALMLQANPELTWRDVQHIIVRTSKSDGLQANDWVVNGAGFNVSHLFGFGLLDAAGVTHVARTWHEVPEQKKCMTGAQRLARDISPTRVLVVSMETRACHRQGNEVAYLEHVVLRITLTHSRRGGLEIDLISPSGTTSNILPRRDYDRSKHGFKDWDFMTTHHWGENPMGVWTLHIRANKLSRHHRDLSRQGQLLKWELIFYGTSEHPQPHFHFENCDAFPQDQCHEECNGCCGASSLECRSCRNVKTMQGECLPSCANDEFVDGEERICKPCWRSCRTCNDAGPSNCMSCFHGYTIVDGECRKICNQGFYLEATSQICRLCDEICKTCQNRSSHCTSCRSSYIFDGNTCRPACPAGTYYASFATGCRPCSTSCRTCSRSAARCNECADGYLQFRQRCVITCPKRHFLIPQTNVCKECHSTCRTCIGPNKTDCTRCAGNRVLENGLCRESCQDEPTLIGQTHCSFILRIGLCVMDYFKEMCCHTCSSFDEYDYEDDDYSDILADGEEGRDENAADDGDVTTASNDWDEIFINVLDDDFLNDDSVTVSDNAIANNSISNNATLLNLPFP